MFSRSRFGITFGLMLTICSIAAAQEVWTNLVHNRDLRDIAWTGELYVAVGDTGEVLTSPDGSRWGRQQTPTKSNLWGIVWTGDMLVAVGESGTVLVSSDGEAWDAHSVGTAEELSRLVVISFWYLLGRYHIHCGGRPRRYSGLARWNNVGSV